MTSYERITFPRIKLSASKSGKCSACGKRTKRSKTFERTVNPWNRHDDGTPKSRSEVYSDVAADVIAWKSAPLLCTACEDEAS